MRGKRELYFFVAALILLQAAFVASSSLEITGRQSYIQNVYSEAQIQKYISISTSGNLSAGIEFGTITVLPSTDVNATKNYNSTVDDSWHNETLYWIVVSGDSNTNVDLCVKADNLNTSGGDEIPLTNYNWSDNVTNDEFWPSLGDSRNMTNTSYVKGSADIPAGSSNYYRFWLSVPASQPAGTYNNTVYFKAVENGTACGT